MLDVAEPKRGRKAGGADGEKEKRRRNVIFISLDDRIEAALQKFLSRHRVKPDRSAVGLAALIEFLEREKCLGPAAE
jgi:hypothetical protein